MKEIYKIANFYVSLDAQKRFHEILKGYEDCCLPESIDLKIKVIIKDKIIEQGDLCRTLKSAKLYSDTKYYYVYHYVNDICYASIKYDNEYKNCTIEIKKDTLVNGLNVDDLVYIYLGMVYGYRITYKKGIMMHGSAIRYKDYAIIFSAPSGVGKSTQANLWKEKFKSDVEIINDDKPTIIANEKDVYCFGTPFSGKDHKNSNKMVKVRAIVNVVRGKENKVEKLDMQQGLVLMCEAFTRSTFDKYVNINGLQTIDQIMQNVPIYRLTCTPTIDAVDILFNRIVE